MAEEGGVLGVEMAEGFGFLAAGLAGGGRRGGMERGLVGEVGDVGLGGAGWEDEEEGFAG